MQNFSQDSSRRKRSCRAGSRREREREFEGGIGIISLYVLSEGGRSMIRLPVYLSSGRATLEPVFKLRVISFV